MQERLLSFVDSRHIRAKRLRKRKQDGKIQENLEHTLVCHSSPFKSAPV